MSELRPYPFGALVRRMLRELGERRSIFDLAQRSFVLGGGGRDLSVRFHGRRASTPLGPAAGPQSQMAQNIALAWLGGSRILELKTVQVDDRLKIPRPCIDMQTVGFNVEWSQELRLEESLAEYVKGAMLVEILKAELELELEPGFGDTIYDMSVGYDLAGIRGERVQAFVRGMRDATALVDRLRAEIPDEWAHLRELEFPTRLSDTLTLSTFHGCRPDEIEAIAAYLLEEVGLHTIVKLNPMLLGPRDARALLNERLGYGDLRVPDTAFAGDPTWEQAVDFTGRLAGRATSLGLGFGVKLTNTLVVENHREFFPAEQREMYLSGPPLHVLAMELVRRFRGAFGDALPISFSAGIDRKNFSDAVALGLVPVTVCTDLLKPGGYARSAGYLEELGRRMEAVGASTVAAFVERAHGPGGTPTSNTERYVPGLADDPRYHRERNEKVPRKLGTRLELFDCVTCDKCVPVCPNDANFSFVLPPLEVPVLKVRPEGGGGDGWVGREDGTLAIRERRQFANFADFCNDCGNCDVFCPEDGGPYVVKPRFFGALEDWRRFEHLDGFCLERDPQDRWGDVLHLRVEGRELRVRFGRRLVYEGEGFTLRFDPADPVATLAGRADGEVDLTWARIAVWMRDAVWGAGAGSNYLASL